MDEQACEPGHCERGCFVAWVTRLVRHERPRLVGIARSEGLGDAEALDAVQSALVTFVAMPAAWNLVDHHSAPPDGGAARPGQAGACDIDDDGARLLSTVVRNAARNLRRRHHRAQPHDGDLDGIAADAVDPATAFAQAEAQLAASACVAALGPEARRVVVLRLLDELSGDEVAAQLGTTPGNVAVMLHRAKAKLRACLADAGVTAE